MVLFVKKIPLQVQLPINAGSGWMHSARSFHYFMLVSCHFKDCKVLLVMSSTHVISAVASVQSYL